MNTLSYEEDKQNQLCLIMISAKVKHKGAVKHIRKDFQYNPKGHREGYREEVKAMLRPNL